MHIGAQLVLQVFAMLLLLGAGMVARRRRMLSEAGTADMASVLMDLVYPALIISSLTTKQSSALMALSPLVACAIVFVLLGLALGWLARRFFRSMPVAMESVFLFDSAINNYIFLPLPVAATLFGDDGIAAVVFAAIGFEICIWTVGVWCFSRHAPGGIVWRNIFFRPAPLAVVGSIVWVITRDHLGITAPGGVKGVMGAVGQAVDLLGKGTIPISFLVAGSRMAGLRVAHFYDVRAWAVTVLRLVVIPVLTLPLLILLPLTTVARDTLAVVMVMPASVASVVFTERYRADVEFSALILLLSHAVALITVPVILWLWLK